MFDLCDLLNIICFDRPAILCSVPVRMILYITTATQYLGTSWYWYELVKVRVGIRYELAWVRVGTVRLG